MLLGLALLAGCQSPYYADRGAFLGGVTGAGVGAAVGKATGNTLAGTALGSAVGVMTGAAVGSGLDEINARNQALIEERLGRRLVGATTINDTIAMTRAGLSDEVIVQHLRSHGLTGQLSASDLITLKEQGVSDRVLQAMQEIGSAAYRAPPPRRQPVIVEEHYYDVHPVWGPDCWYPRHHHHHLRARHSRHNLHWGFSFSD